MRIYVDFGVSRVIVGAERIIDVSCVIVIGVSCVIVDIGVSCVIENRRCRRRVV